MLKRNLATAGVLGLLAMSANAATIEYHREPDLNVISITGKIEQGDAAQFNRVAAPLTGRTVVFLASPGGMVADGLDIGLKIRRSGYATVVLNNQICASICGFMWLAGIPRFLTDESQVGFHSAYGEDGSTNGPANALIGAYLREMGLSYEAVYFLTESPPEQITWLHPSDAKRVGIAYTVIPKEVLQPKSSKFGDETDVPVRRPAPAAPPTSQSAPAPSSAEQQAIRLVADYTDYWANAGTNVEGLSRYYASQVTFYGGNVSREKVMDEKRKYALRWPVRHQTIVPGSVFAQCGADGCSVTGVITWDYTSQERGAHSTGSANFAYRIVNGVIVSENGSVLTRQATTAEEQQSSTTAAYAQGRQARVDFEQWVNALVEGPYKDGVQFWAAHRSDRPQPSCNGPTEFRTGCIAARDRLTPSDARRVSEKDFWFGWNSI